jgi:hypothetical protein
MGDQTVRGTNGEAGIVTKAEVSHSERSSLPGRQEREQGPALHTRGGETG